MVPFFFSTNLTNLGQLCPKYTDGCTDTQHNACLLWVYNYYYYSITISNVTNKSNSMKLKCLHALAHCHTQWQNISVLIIYHESQNNESVDSTIYLETKQNWLLKSRQV